MSRKLVLLLLIALLAAACSQIPIPGGVVPTTGNDQSQSTSVQRFIPNLSNFGYTSIEASSIQTALSGVSGGASLLTGNPAAAALVAQIDGMITCYRNVGALDARVYYQADIANLISGTTPSVGALAVVNQDRLVSNFLACALGSQGRFGAQSAQIQPCSGSGSIVVDGETISYLYAATDLNLCNLMTTPFTGR